MKSILCHSIINISEANLIKKNIFLFIFIFLSFLFLSIKPTKASNNIASYLCNDRKNCEVIEINKAGKNIHEQEMKIVKLKVTRKNENKIEMIKEHKEVIPYEYWLITGKENNPSKQLILRLFNNGYGSAMVGEDTVTITDNLLTHQQSGGSAWRWKFTTQLQLSPLSLVSKTSSAYWTYSSNVEESFWDWQNFRGQSKWFSPDCQEQNFEEKVADFSLAKYNFSYLPQIKLPEEYINHQWMNTELGTCSTELSHPKNMTNPSPVKIITTPEKWIFIQVDESKNKKDYQLNLYFNFNHTSYATHCLNQKEINQNFEHYQIDGHTKKISKIKTSPLTKIKLSHHPIKSNGNHFVIYKITIPSRSDSIQNYNLTVSYDSKTEHFANSDPTHKENLGELYRINENSAECVIENGKLIKKILPRISPDQAILSF